MQHGSHKDAPASDTVEPMLSSIVSFAITRGCITNYSGGRIGRLISVTLLKSVGDDVVTSGCGVNIGKDAAHPRVTTDVMVRDVRASKGSEDIYDGTKTTYIGSKMGVDLL